MIFFFDVKKTRFCECVRLIQKEDRVKTNSRENYQAFQRCYNQYLVILNNVFPLGLALRLRNGQKKTDYLHWALQKCHVKREIQNLQRNLLLHPPYIETKNDTSHSVSKKILKRDSWSNNQTGALINVQNKKNFMKLRHIYSQVHG